jgi:hypothetical protein
MGTFGKIWNEFNEYWVWSTQKHFQNNVTNNFFYLKDFLENFKCVKMTFLWEMCFGTTLHYII